MEIVGCIACVLSCLTLVKAKALTFDPSMLENSIGVFEPFVVSGSDADDEWAFMASLQFYDTWFGEYYHVCGAALISSVHVVTAAHCVDDRVGGEGRSDPGRYRVMLGGLNVLTSSDDDVYLSVAAIIKHDLWEVNPLLGFPNDIAVLRLSSMAPVGRPDITPIALPTSSGDFTGSACYILGWGLTSGDAETPPEVLQEASTNVIGPEECQREQPYMVRDSHVCVGGPGQPLACSGDSGGPLACKVGSSWQLAGIGSWSFTCDDTPSVYTSIPPYAEWIVQHP
ncbi:hypothetical protein CAPTEDRAFT_172265 [Capitella teleta]|uniref:Peptidase S1 domain-containing protein n=1 Tax=Capitella teleta TaxID=283909 RepID=R7UHD2_CAPTE|nr:hypothetical protein CAPTEDRAFT_172265 [Capitella teleta]|eukprot:ELU05595.1 hypothetical protein CAPTEDRAFT_172265 [Capitella teleta]